MGSGPGSQGALIDLGVGVLVVFLLSCIGYPSQSGFKPKSGRSQAWDALHYANGNGISPRYEAQKEFSRIFRDKPGIVLSDIDPSYLNALLPKSFVAAPIDDHHYYSYSRLWRYGKVEASRLVQSGLDHATPVYASSVPSIDDDHAIQRLPSIQGLLETEREIQFTGRNHDIDKGCLSSDVEIRVLLSGVVTNEAICRYPLLQ